MKIWFLWLKALGDVLSSYPDTTSNWNKFLFCILLLLIINILSWQILSKEIENRLRARETERSWKERKVEKKFNKNYVKRDVIVRFMKSVVLLLNKVLWHSDKRGDK